MISQVMRFYGGSISYNEIMEMPYKTFLMLFDYMLWQLRSETEEGRKINQRIERTDLFKAFGASKIRGQESKDVGRVMQSIKHNLSK